MHVSLVGLPGVGKSTIGRRVAKRLGAVFVDADERFEADAGCPIAEFFEHHGEQAFRALETRLLASIIQSPERSVVATGGGIVLDPDNRSLLRESTTCVYLHAPPNNLVHRVARRTTRPLFRGLDPGQKLNELYAHRDPLYRACATVVVSVERTSPDAAADSVVEALTSAGVLPRSDR